MASAVAASSSRGGNAKSLSRSPAPRPSARRAAGPPLDKQRSSQLGADARARARGADLARKLNMLSPDPKRRTRVEEPLDKALTELCPCKDPKTKRSCASKPSAQGHTMEVVEQPEEEPHGAQDSNQCSSKGLDSIFLKPLTHAPEDSSSQTPTCSSTPTFPLDLPRRKHSENCLSWTDPDMQQEDDMDNVLRKHSNVSLQSADVDSVLRKSEVLRSLLAAALADDYLDSRGLGDHQDAESNIEDEAISTFSSPMARARERTETIEVPVGLLDAFSMSVSQCEELRQDVERLSATRAKHNLDVLESYKKKAQGRDRLSSLGSSSGMSTTGSSPSDDMGSSWSDEPRIWPDSLSQRSTFAVPNWLAHTHPSSAPPPVAASFSRAMSPTIGQRKLSLSGSVSIPAATRAVSPSFSPSFSRALSPAMGRRLAGSATIPVAIRRAPQQQVPRRELLPVNALQGRKPPLSVKVTQQQSITITSQTHITVELS